MEKAVEEDRDALLSQKLYFFLIKFIINAKST